jgi:hypothetical protein
MKLIFLDIDGVINSTRTAIAHGGYPYKMPIERGLGKFDKTAIRLIRKLVKETGSKVVISSTWRGSAKGVSCFDALGLPVIGMTPQRSPHGYERGYEIRDYLDEFMLNSEPHDSLETYVIIDDDSDMLEVQKKHFVKVDSHNGFSFQNYMDCSKILEGYELENNYRGFDIWTHPNKESVMIYKDGRYINQIPNMKVATNQIDRGWL